MVILTVLKWIVVAVVGLFALFFLYFLIFPKSREAGKPTTRENPAAVKSLPQTFEEIPPSIVFETSNGTSGKLTVVEVIERQAKGGTVLVIPLLPVPIAGEMHDVKARYFYYTAKDGQKGQSRKFSNFSNPLHRTDVLNAYYFKENPLARSEDFIFQLDSTFADQLADIANCILQNKKDLESFLGKDIAAVVIAKKQGVAPDADIVFFPPNPDPQRQFLIGFEYSGNEFSELQVIYRLKEGDHFKNYDHNLGDIFLQSRADLLEQIQQASLDTFRERKFPNPPPPQGLQYRLYLEDDRVPHPNLEQVFQALKSLPQMVSQTTGVGFPSYYAGMRDLLENPKHYLPKK